MARAAINRSLDRILRLQHSGEFALAVRRICCVVVLHLYLRRERCIGIFLALIIVAHVTHTLLDWEEGL